MCYVTLLTWSCGCIVTQHLVRCQAAINKQPCETQRQVHRVSMDCSLHKTVNPRDLTTQPTAGDFVEEMRVAEAQWNKEYEEQAEKEKAARVAAQAAADAREQAQIATELWEEAQEEARIVADAEAYKEAQAVAEAVFYTRAQAEEAAGMRTPMAQARTRARAQELAQAQAQAAAADEDMEDVGKLQPPVRKVGRPGTSSRIDYAEPPDEEFEELEPPMRTVGRPRTSSRVQKAESKTKKPNKKFAHSWAYVDEDEIEPTQAEIFERIARQS